MQRKLHENIQHTQAELAHGTVAGFTLEHVAQIQREYLLITPLRSCSGDSIGNHSYFTPITR